MITTDPISCSIRILRNSYSFSLFPNVTTSCKILEISNRDFKLIHMTYDLATDRWQKPLYRALQFCTKLQSNGSPTSSSS